MYRRELLAGVLSGLIGWAGALVLPENSWVLDVYPGVVLALAFYWAMPPAQGTSLLPRLIVVGCYLAGWKMQIKLLSQHALVFVLGFNRILALSCLCDCAEHCA
ncbi:MAG: hypothetical protein F9K47_03760, partial [Burkholderiales bacterium]